MTRNKNIFLLALLMALILLLGSCRQHPDNTRIAISYIYGDTANDNYINWLKRINPSVDYVVMYELPKDSVDIVFAECTALLLTGGRDIYPARYGKENDTARCGNFDLYRDSLEFNLIYMAMEREMPILGVCRGQQILNVAMGGTLYVDIPTDINSMVNHRCEDWRNCYHRVKVLPENLLSRISGVSEENITTNHHQAIDRLAKDFKVLAVSSDGIIESIGWKDTLNKPFLIAVQWHPERMDTLNMLSVPIARKFLEAADKFRN